MQPYDADYYQGNSQDGDRIALRWYSRVMKRYVPAGSRILDFGCGMGFMSSHLAKWAVPVSLDLSETARSATAARVPGAVVVASLDEVGAGSLDAVVALHVLEHVADPRPILDEFHRRLKPEGILFFVVPDTEGTGHRKKGEDWFAYKDPTHCCFLPSRQWREMTVDAGFDIVVEGSDGLWDSPYSKRLPWMVDRLFYGFPLIVDVLRSRINPAPNRGECTVLIARKPVSVA